MSRRAEKNIMFGQFFTWRVIDYQISGAEVKEIRGGIQEQQVEWKGTLVWTSGCCRMILIAVTQKNTLKINVEV